MACHRFRRAEMLSEVMGCYGGGCATQDTLHTPFAGSLYALQSQTSDVSDEYIIAIDPLYLLTAQPRRC